MAKTCCFCQTLCLIFQVFSSSGVVLNDLGLWQICCGLLHFCSQNPLNAWPVGLSGTWSRFATFSHAPTAVDVRLGGKWMDQRKNTSLLLLMLLIEQLRSAQESIDSSSSKLLICRPSPFVPDLNPTAAILAVRLHRHRPPINAEAQTSPWVTGAEARRLSKRERLKSPPDSEHGGLLGQNTCTRVGQQKWSII